MSRAGTEPGQESAREPGVGSLDAPDEGVTRAKVLALTIRLRAWHLGEHGAHAVEEAAMERTHDAAYTRTGRPGAKDTLRLFRGGYTRLRP